MNSIDIRRLKTVYNYAEHYICIDGRPIVEYLDEYIQNELCPRLAEKGSMLGLAAAWSNQLEWQWENDFVWELAQSHEELNVPLLVCEDDNDLSCIIIVVHIRRKADVVCWDRIGLLLHDNYDQEKAKRYGILYHEAYSEEDWEKYGSNIALESYGSPAHRQWISENCCEEHIRQLRNYFQPYLQQEQNIYWIKNTDWVFPAAEYDCMLNNFERIRQENDVNY